MRVKTTHHALQSIAQIAYGYVLLTHFPHVGIARFKDPPFAMLGIGLIGFQLNAVPVDFACRLCKRRVGNQAAIANKNHAWDLSALMVCQPLP